MREGSAGMATLAAFRNAHTTLAIISCDDANPPSLPRAGLPPNHDLDILVDRRQRFIRRSIY